MLKNLDQSVDLLCDFYNLDLQLDEPIEALLGEQPGSDLSPDLNAMKDAIDAADKGDNHHLNRLLRDLSETGQKRFVSRRDRDRIKRFMNKHLEWGAVDTFETWLKAIPEIPQLGGNNWFTGAGVVELLYDFHTVRCFTRHILQSRIGEDVLLRIGDLFELVGSLELSHWELLPKKQYYGPHSDRRHHNMWAAASFVADINEELVNLKKVSNDKGYWELSDVKWEVNNFQLMLGSIYGLPMGFVMKKALASSIQAIINGEKSVRKCTLCDRIFRVPKVNGDLKKYCGSGCRTTASKARSISKK